MKFSLNLAQKFSNVDLKSIPHEDILRTIGAQLGSVEDTYDWKSKYEGVVVAKIVTCIKHPNADKLNLCTIDDGGITADINRDENSYIQVVCGAPNVREGLLVAWIPPGATVPSSSGKEPFVLEARELRGKMSNGMIASPKELDISDDHEGILEIDESDSDRGVSVGQAFSDLYGLDDFVIECENKMFTHRPDCFGNLGIARELAGINGMKFESPGWYKEVTSHESRVDSQQQTVDSTQSGGENISKVVLQITNDIPELVPRFMVVAMGDVENKTSPVWVQSTLKRVGIKPISAVVDATNIVMHLTGQPLHAFDLDKIKALSDTPGIHPRMAKSGEKLSLLGGKDIELNENDIVIATDKQAVALAGVMGGSETEVDAGTKNILIECANFDMYTIRRTSMRHGLFTDAVTRFNKGQSPLQNDKILGYALKLMSELAGAHKSSEIYDISSFDLNADNLNKVSVTTQFINSRLGSDLSAVEIKNLLENVEFEVALSENNLLITAPFWRMDISIAEDIVEEVGRLYGYDKLPLELLSRSAKPAQKNPLIEFKQNLVEDLSKMGASEVLTYSFVHGDLLRNTGTDPEKWAYHLRNALSPDLQYYRTSLIPSLLSKVHSNIKAQAGIDDNAFALFEIGRAHVKGEMEDAEPTLPRQMHRLAFVYAADEKSVSNVDTSAYYTAKLYLDKVLNGQAVYVPLETNEYPITAAYQIGRSAMVMINDQILGVIGEFNVKAKKSLKLPDYCAGFELDIELVRQHLKAKKYSPISIYPSVMQDVTLEVSKSTAWFELKNLVEAEMSVVSAQNDYNYELTPGDIFTPDNSDNKNISFSMELTHPNKTLKKEELSRILESIQKVVHEKLG